MAQRVAAKWMAAGRGGPVVLTDEDYDELDDHQKKYWQGYYYKMTYEVWTPEDVEHGDASDRGWEEHGSDPEDSLEDLLHNSDISGKSWTEWSDSSPGPRSWIVSHGEADHRTGERTNNSLWIMRKDKQPLTREEIQYISRELGVR